MLMENARSMLSSAGIGQELWAEAVETTCYSVNQSPTLALIDKTPQVVWNGKKSFIKHLKFFGCDSYVHVAKDKRSKLDNKYEKCIFIGYKDGIIRFRIL